MPVDTLTIALNGEVPLEAYAEAIQHFRKLIEALTVDEGLTGEID